MIAHSKSRHLTRAAVLLAVMLAAASTLLFGQSLAGTAAGAGRLWTAVPLLVRVSAPPVPASGYSPGENVGRIVIPKISLDLPLGEMANCDDQANLDRGPCHIGGTALPGREGNSGIAGHRSTYGQPFRAVGSLATGDEIVILEHAGARFSFRVTAIWVVSPSDVWVLDPTPEPSLTLITCHPVGSDASRLIVRATLSR
jgi:sortase A